jgi:hypothetical protein
MAATAAVPSNISSIDDLAIKSENITYRVYVTLDDKGKIADTEFGTAGKDNAFWNKMDKLVEAGTHQLALEQTVKAYKVGTIEGLISLIEDNEEVIAIINRGLTAKYNQKIGAALKELTDDGANLKFEPIDGAYDSLSLLQEPTVRKNLSPTDKALKLMRQSFKVLFPDLTEEQLEVRLSEMLAASQK